jgi:hypothetical protein
VALNEHLARVAIPLDVVAAEELLVAVRRERRAGHVLFRHAVRLTAFSSRT